MNQATSLLSPSPSSSIERPAVELTPVIEKLKIICSEHDIDFQLAATATECLLRLRHTFIDSDHPREAKEDFRHLHGFQTLLELLRKVSESYTPDRSSKEERKCLLTLFKDALAVLAEALKEHHGNKRYFASRVPRGGRVALEEALALLAQKVDCVQGDIEQFYSGILAAVLCQEAVTSIFTTLDAKFRTAPELLPSDIKVEVDRCVGTSETIEVPDILGPFIRVWLSQTSASSSGHGILRLAVPACLCQLASHSQRNITTLHATGVLSWILPLLVSDERPEPEKLLYQELARLLCAQGISNLEDAVFLYQKAHSCPKVSRLLVDVLKASKEPASIQFDLSLHGYGSLEFSTLGRSFPPATSSGYTLSVWARFDQFDPNTHTTIFGAFDPSQTCFLLAYLEKDTRNFILQTSIRGSRPSVRFKSVVFEPGRWYHICVVHKKPRPPSYSRASLFIDGEFVEQLKIEYPCMPATSAPSRSARVQAFFGTPQDLAMRLGKGVSMSRWSLASAILFEEAYSDDMVAVFYNLGARYYGNFQDCLGSFQTYKASAALNLRNEHLHPGKEEQSDIVVAIRRKASTLIREGSILLNVSPLSVLDDDDDNTVDESRLIKCLSRQAAKNLHQLTKSGGNAVAVNGATPAINDALTQAHGIGVLTGHPVVTVPHSLDDASWRIGGCASVHLNLVHAADTAESTLLAVEALYEAVQDSWRNSEAMEKENGYGILGALLREKLGLPSGVSSTTPKTPNVCSSYEERSALALELLRLTLKFVGYEFEQPNRSIITNPLAYRVLLVDLEVWRYGEAALLELYYSQFCIFASESQFRRFNAKRLARMRVNKKFLEALKVEEHTPEALRLHTAAFGSLMEGCLSADLLRSLALYITYALHKPRESSRLQKKKSMRFNTGVRPVTPAAKDKYVSSTVLATEMLRMYSSLLCNAHDLGPIKKFARAVTNKWLLYLMCEDEPEIVILATKIIARLLAIHGSNYDKKFTEKTGGYIIMRHCLKRWWRIPAVWSICFAILFGLDVGKMIVDRPFNQTGLSDTFLSGTQLHITFPEIFPVIAEMMQSALKETALTSGSPQSDMQGLPILQNVNVQPTKRTIFSHTAATTVAEEQLLFGTVIDFFATLHVKSQSFRVFTTQPEYTQHLLSVLFPVVVGCDATNTDAELNPRAGSLDFSDQNLVLRPRSRGAAELRTTTVEQPGPRDDPGGSLGRGSSFVLVSSERGKPLPSSARIVYACSPRKIEETGNPDHPFVISILSLALSVFSEQLLERKDFSGLGLYLKTPPGLLEHRAHFNSWVLKNFLSTAQEVIFSKPHLLAEPRVLTNLGRFTTHLGEAVYEGWFVDGAAATLEFAGPILEYLQRPDISCLKSIRLCSQAVSIIRSTVFRAVLLRLSEVEGTEALLFLKRLSYWQVVLLAGDAHSTHLQLLCYLLYIKLDDGNEDVRLAAAGLFRILLVQKPADMATILSHAPAALQKRLSAGFEALMGMDDAAFLQWFNDREEDLHSLFFDVISKHWEDFVQEENSKIEATSRNRVSKRQEKLKQWKQIDAFGDEVTRKHVATFSHWASNISASEFLKLQRALQDHQDDQVFMWTAFSQLTMDLRRFGGLLAENKERKWRLDQTEGRSRMRLRIVPDETNERQNYQPKRKASEPPAIKLDTEVRPPSSGDALGLTPIATVANNEAAESTSQGIAPDSRSVLEDSFEMIEDPKADLDDYEDKNRKVMRTLHRGDQVEGVCNMSRIIGLEAFEGLLIQGKDHIYILDNFFQRSDGEIVNVWQAPADERDPYVRMIAGRESSERKAQEHETRSWKWSDLISISKRRFLFRDVALEVFFTDGSSYLLTLISSRARDGLCSQLAAKAPQVTGSVGHARPEDVWRFETLRSQEDAPQSLGSKFASVFGHSPAYPATRKWVKGEISNFHYLMLINTLAGRTFNDLTQYPVFPWVLADYTSDELDLTNPQTFRDLSKPMGCQTPEREADFRERYKAFAEMGDDDAPPFHYGTHYSSAMIVSSYLIRLQPFVKSYLLLQGGTFDHADRLFYSVGKAWESASRGNMSDVRELIPEFFYLSEFLVNSNKYDFGLLQNMTTVIDSVELPPWAKGDPKIFIAKHREALESPYVTQNLHHWIDLVFGSKQKGEAAVEAVNVFHHLSYQGAKDVDSIDDPVERLATIGIIHNFGQTPHQIFNRPHSQREDPRHKMPRLDRLAESLTQQPLALLDIGERVASLSMKHDRLLCAAALRLNIPPSYDKYMEWGFFDGSVRFYSADSRKVLLGHFEHLHIGQLSCAIFADSRTLITAGTDCTVAIWTFTSSVKSVDLQPAGSLFGHRSPVTMLAVSRSFSTLLSASTDGQIMLWDLNRQCFVRELPNNGPVDCARINDVTGEIMICRRDRVSLYTLNGSLLLEQVLCDSVEDSIMTCVFYEGVNNEWQERELLFTGHRRGVVNIWSKIIHQGRFELELIRQLHHVDSLRDNGANISAGISCILAQPHVVYTGDEGGRVYEWSCVQRR
ncbi:beige/beach domain protein [Aspergillus sclerotioniger CBS 115572]|uniref:Beige/beach domain protein n=1 Tax=Aspergillus sclerotioniger CBS 115572 TaxID=1450535 RepID=A0A317XF79_9EURO|nr:beige/beach domain protein [Aspergillus sclerotioniger CBS 115572]PWY96407.1 beige/beach domain protein [Aspergillus sclerotioniger CBS 115572]